MNRLTLHTLLLTAILATVSWQVHAKQADKLFRSDDILKITLVAPFTQINATRDKSITYSDAILSYVDDQGIAVKIGMDLEVRGNFRLQNKVCKFPPLRLIVDGDSAKDTLFAKQKKLKLVTTCKPGSSKYEQYLIKEYLIYRMFNALTTNSFRVRMVEVTYQESEAGKPDTHYGFFIEGLKRLAKRLEHEEADIPAVNPEDHDLQQMNLVSMFQYMVGNTDWSSVQGEPDEDCCHNAKLLKDGNNKYLAIPYDFDFSGFVNAEYAYPNPKFPIRSVKRRYFRGFCQPDDVVRINIDLFNSKKSELLAVIENNTLLSNSNRKRGRRYLDGFYDIINSPDRLKSQILDKCRSYTQAED